MTIEQLRKMHAARPFQPFELYLADGRVVAVEHPEFLAQSPSGRTIGVGQADDAIEAIDLLLVVSIKPKSPKSNGRSRRRRQE